MTEDHEHVMRMIEASQNAVLDQVAKMLSGQAMRPATVFIGLSGEQGSNREVPVVLDGDQEAAAPGEVFETVVPMINLTGSALTGGQRVMVQFVPPRAGFIVAKMPPFRVPCLKLVFGSEVSIDGPVRSLPLGTWTDLEGEQSDFDINYVSDVIQALTPGRYLLSGSIQASNLGATRQRAFAQFTRRGSLTTNTSFASVYLDPGESVYLTHDMTVITLYPGDTLSHESFGGTDVTARSLYVTMAWNADVPPDPPDPL